jgi:hypothetical protein
MGLLVTRAAACALAAAQRVAAPGELNHGFLDPYSLVHVLVGVVIALFGLGFVAAIAIAVGWELAEHVLKNLAPAAFPHPTQDTLANSAGDVLSTAFGWIVAAALRSRQPPRESGSTPVPFLRWRLRLRGARRRP